MPSVSASVPIVATPASIHAHKDPRMTTLTREAKFIGGYDWRDPPDYGIHGMDLIFAVKGPLGAISITISTNWMLPQHQSETQKMYGKGYPWEIGHLCRPNIVDVGYHSKVPQYEGQSGRIYCELTDGPCYSDGSSLSGNEYYRDGFLHGGSDWLFARMEEEYCHHFENGPPPNFTPIPRPHPKTKNAQDGKPTQ